MAPDNGWNEWSKHVLLELQRLNSCYQDIDKKLDKKIEAIHEKIDDKIAEVIKKLEKVNTRLTLLQIKTAGLSATVALIITITVMIIANILRNK